jgi:hypothetical protein
MSEARYVFVDDDVGGNTLCCVQPLIELLGVKALVMKSSAVEFVQDVIERREVEWRFAIDVVQKVVDLHDVGLDPQSSFRIAARAGCNAPPMRRRQLR